MSVGHFYSDLVLRESLLWNGLLSKSIIFCVWPAGFSSVLLTRKPLNIAWLVSLHKHIRLTWAPKIAGHGCALSVPCATTICFSAQKEKKWFNSVSRNQSCSALDLQLQNGGDRFGQLSCPGIYFAQYVPLQNNSCKLFTRALFSIGLWNSSGRSNRLAFTPQKSVHVWQKEKVWKLLLLLKETWQLSLLWTNVCVLKTLTVQPCVLGILLMERSQFPTRFPSRARRASIPLVRELSLQVLEWMEEMADLVSPGVPKNEYTALTSHFLSLVFSDHHLIQSGRSGMWSAACAENWGSDRQFFPGNCLCDGCTEQHSATKLFDVSTPSEAIWKNCDDQ